MRKIQIEDGSSSASKMTAILHRSKGARFMSGSATRRRSVRGLLSDNRSSLGEDYLYPSTFFREVALPQSLRRAVLAAA